MSMEFRKVLYSRRTGDVVHWGDDRPTKEEIIEYAQKHRFPDNNVYTLDDFIADVQSSEGPIAFGKEVPDSVVEWVEMAVNALYFC